MERPPHKHESAPAYPTYKDIVKVFKKIVGNRPVVGEIDPRADENNEILILTIEAINPDGSREELQYVRSRTSEGGDDIPVILVTDIHTDGTLGKQAILAEYRNGAWKMKEGVDRYSETDNT